MRSFGSLSVTTALLAVMASTTTVSAQECTVCGNAANNFTNARAEWNGLTCDQLQTSLEDLGTPDLCTAVLEGDRYNWFQYESFCGCEGVTAPESYCKICDDDEIVAFPNNFVPWDNEEERYNCNEAVELARHVSDPTICANEVATAGVKQTCCRKKGEGCPTCTLGGGFKTNSRYSNITCDLITAETFELDNVQCKAYYGRDTHYWMNWETFCGCDGAVIPEKPCTLCGSNLEVVNPDAITPWVNETDVYTCAEANALALHIKDNDVCVDEVQTPAVLAACCGPITGGGGGGGDAASAAFTPLALLSAATSLIGAIFMVAMS